MGIIMKLIIFTLFGFLLLSSCTKKGCTDQLAHNYDESAVENNGSCDYSQSIEKYDLITDVNDFVVGSNSMFYVSYEITDLEDDDALLMEWKCGNCHGYVATPFVSDNFYSVYYERDGDVIHVVIQLFENDDIIYDPYRAIFDESRFRFHVIKSKTLEKEDIDINDIDAQQKYILNQPTVEINL